MKLILMTTPYFFTEEDQILTALFDEGLELLHLRKPGTEPILSERLLSLLPEEYRKRIVVHDHFYLKNEYNLRGVHLNGRNPQLPDKYKGHISCTCYNFEELGLRKKQMDYSILSPLYDEDGTPNFPTAQLQEMAKKGVIDKKVMAQGHVTLAQIAKLRDLGFGGVVVIGDLWNRFSIHSAQDYRELITHFRKLRKAAG